MLVPAGAALPSHRLPLQAAVVGRRDGDGRVPVCPHPPGARPERLQLRRKDAKRHFGCKRSAMAMGEQQDPASIHPAAKPVHPAPRAAPGDAIAL